MAFCKQCGLRLDSTLDHCPHCGIIINPVSQEDDFRASISTMPPEHVLKRRKLFPTRDALYTPLIPEYRRFQQGARVVRKTNWLAYSGVLFICFLLLICVYNVLSAGFIAFQWLLAPTPASPLMEFTPLAAEQTPHPAFLIARRPAPVLHKHAHATPTPHKHAHTTLTPHKRTHATSHKHAHIRPHATPTPTPDIASLLEEARAVINTYYRDINAKVYKSAYALWLNNPLAYAAFTQGFAHTQHNIVRFGVLEAQSDTTVSVALTVQATESFSHHHHTHTRISLYRASYLVQRQPDQSWRIIAASFTRL